MSKIAGAGLIEIEVLNSSEYPKKMIIDSATAQLTIEPELNELKEMKVSHVEIKAWKK